MSQGTTKPKNKYYIAMGYKGQSIMEGLNYANDIELTPQEAEKLADELRRFMVAWRVENEEENTTPES